MIETITIEKTIKVLKILGEAALICFLLAIFFIPAWIIIIWKLTKIYKIKKEMRFHAALNMAVHSMWDDLILKFT